MAQPLQRDVPQSPYSSVREPINALLQRREYKAALEILSKIHGDFPGDPQMLDDMASCYWSLGDHETAIKLLSHIVELAPANPAAWGKLGAMTMSVGDTSMAETAFSQVLKLTPNAVPALAALNRIKIFDRKSHRAKTLRKLAENKNLSAVDRATACNALGRIEEAAGNHRIAFRFFAKSKMHCSGTFDAAAFEHHIADQKRLFKPSDVVPPSTTSDPRIVFIVGLPRSGSTLVESILCRHPEVQSLGENLALQNVLAICRQDIATQHGAGGEFDWVGRLSAAQVTKYRSLYLQRSLQSLQEAPAPVLVDKLPFNCFEIGFAQTILPEARFIFMSRHPLDVGLSNFSTNFFSAHAFSKRLDTIGQMTRAVYTSLEDYEDKIGHDLRRQSYSALVSSPEPQIRAILDHIDLPWEAACLSPEQGSEIVRTASLMQVRSPISTSALAKWKRYEAELEPLVDALGGWDWIDKWQSDDNACAKIGA